jgi:uncharacterized protein (TIGR02266 family)
MTISWQLDDSGVVPRFALTGELDGDASFDELRFTAERTILDFSGVTAADRDGARALLALVRKLRIDQTVEVRRCAATVLDLLRKTPALAMRLVVKSVLGELRCASCGTGRPVLIRVPAGLSAAATQPCKQCGGDELPTDETSRLIGELCDPAQARRPRAPSSAPVDRAPRHRVHLEVRYRTAAEFVEDHAQDLSTGGLFIRGATDLAVGDPVEVEVDLPGSGSYTVTGRVAHIMTPERAAELDRAAGAGVELTSSSAEFQQAQRAYFERLGRRRDAYVIATNVLVATHVERFGYSTLEAKEPGQLTRLIARADGAVVGIIVGRREAELYRKAAAAHGLDDLVSAVDFLEEIDELLGELDDRMPL